MLLNSLGQGCSNAASRLYDSDDNASTSCMLIGEWEEVEMIKAKC